MWRLNRNERFADVALLLAALFAGSMAYIATQETSHTTIEIEEALTLQPDFTTTWTSAGPLTQTVNTYQKEGDTYDETVTIHAAKVAALQATYPAI